MKHKTWFRLVLQAIGVLLVGFGLPDFIGYVGGYMTWRAYEGGYLPPGSGSQPEWVTILFGVAPSFLQTAFGIYLMTGATWLLNKFIPSNRPYCPECGYDLAHNTGPICPECGVTLSAPPRESAEGVT